MAIRESSWRGHVRNLQDKINELEKENEELKTRIKELEKENKELKMQINKIQARAIQ